MQETGAIHTLDSSDRDVGIAPLAGLGRSRSIGIVGLGGVNISVANLLLSAAQAPAAESGSDKDDQEEGNGNKEEVDGRHEEATDVLGNCTVALGLFGGVVLHLASFTVLEDNEPVLQVGTCR